MKRFIIITLCVLAALPALCGQPAPKPAKALLDAGLASSAKLHRPVMVIFTMSRCPWCKRMDTLMGLPQFKKLFDANYVIVRLDVLEAPDRIKEYENQGGRALLKQYGGEGSSVPYYCWVDAKGAEVANSKVNGTNIAYPGYPPQIDAFMALIKKTAAHWPDADQKALRDYLMANPPK